MNNQGYKIKKEQLQNGKTVYRVRYYADPHSYNDISEKGVMWKGGNSRSQAYEMRKIIKQNNEV